MPRVYGWRALERVLFVGCVGVSEAVGTLRLLPVEHLTGEAQLVGEYSRPGGLGLAASVPKGSAFQVHIAALSLGRVTSRGSI